MLAFRHTVPAAVVALLGVLAWTGAPAQAAQAAPAYDCVIEPQQLVKLSTQAVGVIARLDADRGDVVRQGQVLGKLADDVEAAELELSRARASNEHEITGSQARLAFLRRKYGRSTQLVTDNIVSRAATEEAESDMKVAESQLRMAELNHRIARLDVQRAEALVRLRTLVSPVDGVVVERLLSVGEYRNDQVPVMTLAQLDPLRVEVFLPAAAYGQVRPGQPATITPAFPVPGPRSATVTVVDRVMDAASGTFGVRLRLTNPDLSIPGGIRCRVQFG